jgi:hypothetical protein
MNPVAGFAFFLAGGCLGCFLAEARGRKSIRFLIVSGGVALICAFFALKIQFNW